MTNPEQDLIKELMRLTGQGEAEASAFVVFCVDFRKKITEVQKRLLYLRKK